MDVALDVASLLLHTASTLPRKRWRLAFTVIFSSRAFARATRSIARVLPWSSSYSSISIHDKKSDFLLLDKRQLAGIVKEKDRDALRLYGGVDGVADCLGVDAGLGVEEEELGLRCERFGSNSYVRPKPKGFFRFVFDAANDAMLIILLVCATVSLGFGIKEHGIKEGWYDGVSIYVAVLLVVAVTAVSNYRQERRFEELAGASRDVRAEVVRGGRRRGVLSSELVVGDVVCLKTGDQVPADGVLLDGHSLQLDESSMTGETAHVAVDRAGNPFLPAGTKVADGYGRAVVTAVGTDTMWGEMMRTIGRGQTDPTPLQERLQRLTLAIGKVGTAVAALVLAVLLARYFAGATTDDAGEKEFDRRTATFSSVSSALVRIVSDVVTIIVVAIPEGLPLAVTLTLAFSMRRMMKDNAMVRKLPACETMGAVTAICTDKTGTLTLNRMTVVETLAAAGGLITGELLGLLRCAVAANTTGSVYVPPHPTAEVEVTGSPTEKAILQWAVKVLGLDMAAVVPSYEVLKVDTFSSEKKRSGVLLRRGEVIYVHWKGAAEIILSMCTGYYSHGDAVEAIGTMERMELEEAVRSMAARSLRCIAIACRRVTSATSACESDDELPHEELTLLAIVGLKDPCRPEARTAVDACRGAGVAVKMVTGDNIHTAKAIAVEAGILSPDEAAESGTVVEGREFRELPEDERDAAARRIRVMARSSPADKLLMVQCLRRRGEVVAVTGDGTNDAPALSEADVGLAMGIEGTEVAKGCADVVILDDNFGSVVTVLRWGRCVFTNIQKFLQFQLTVNAVALAVNFVAAVSSGKVPLTTVQMLWVNLIMDTLGALALATERPTGELMQKPPVGRTAPLITNIMWRNIVVQAAFQITALLSLHFRGESVLGVSEKVKNTIVFNTFVFCQLFNEFNARRMERKNIFDGLLHDRLFIVIIAGTVALQVVMVEALQKFADTKRLGWGQWGICIGIAAISWPMGWLAKYIPVPEAPFLGRLGKHRD